MADYYVNGFTPPRGVNNADAVKKVQKLLKVKADGMWGPQTQAAWESQDFASDLTSESARRNESARVNYAVSGYTPPRGITDKYKVKTVQANLGVTQDGVWGPETQAAWERQYGNLWQNRTGDVPNAERSEYISNGGVSPNKKTENAHQQHDMSEYGYSAWLAEASVSDVDEYYDERMRELYEQNIPLKRFIVDNVALPGFSLERESARQQRNVQQLLKQKEAARQAVIQRTEKEHPSSAFGEATEAFFERLADYLRSLWYNDENNDDDMIVITPALSPTPSPTPKPTPKPTPSPTPTPRPPLFEIPDPPNPDKKKEDGTTPWAGEAGVNRWNTLWNTALEELTEYVPRNDAAMTQEQRMNVILNAVKYIGPSYTYGKRGSYQENGETHYLLDCSDLVSDVYLEAGINVFGDTSSRGFARTGKENGWYTPKADMDPSTLYPGDLVIWKKNDGSVGHVGVYLCTVDGQRWVIESTLGQNGPNVSKEWNKYSDNYLVAGYIVPEPNK